MIHGLLVYLGAGVVLYIIVITSIFVNIFYVIFRKIKFTQFDIIVFILFYLKLLIFFFHLDFNYYVYVLLPFLYYTFYLYNKINLNETILIFILSIGPLVALYRLLVDPTFFDIITVHFRDGIIFRTSDLSGTPIIYGPSFALIVGYFLNNNSKLNLLKKIFLLLSTVTILFTFSRSAYLILFVSVLLYFAKRENIKYFILTSIIVSTIFIYYYEDLSIIINEVFRFTDVVTYQKRSDTYSSFFEILRNSDLQQLFTGFGMEAFRPTYLRTISSYGFVIENYFLLTFAEIGIFGLITHVSLILIFLFKIKNFKLKLIISTFIITNMLSISLLGVYTQIIYWLIIYLSIENNENSSTYSYLQSR